jgi:hypothetical protein
MIIADDSLVCFPMRYLTFIKADLIEGDETEKKFEKLKDYMIQKENDFVAKDKQLIAFRDQNEILKDSLEMKNALIQNLHFQISTGRKKNIIYTGVIAVLTILFTVK